LAGFAVRSTTGVTADWLFAATGAVELAGGGAARAGAFLVVVLVVTVRVGVAAGLVATRVVRVVVVVVRLWIADAVAGVLSGADSVALVSLFTGAVSVVAGGDVSIGGVVVVTGGG